MDRDGNIHVVDDESLIPPDCRPDTRVYSDPEDDLSPKDRAKLKATRQREQVAEEARRQAEEERKAREASLRSPSRPRWSSAGTRCWFPSVASLEIDQVEKSHGRVAGGFLVKSFRARRGHLKVGPWQAEDIEVALMDHVGPATAEQGLPGMDLLSRRDCRIDYERQLIRWADPRKTGRE